MAAIDTRHPGLLGSDDTALLVIDMQTAFAPVIERFTEIVNACRILVEGFGVLGAPVVVSQQYPKGLGETVPDILGALPPGTPVVDKVRFSVVGVPGLDAAIRSTGRQRVVVAGIEAHVCVNQSVHDLLAAGYEVILATDAIGSRHPSDRHAGIEKCISAGAVRSTVETVLFEMLEQAGGDQFKTISKLVR
jgi:nicotinamidase-related amidase